MLRRTNLLSTVYRPEFGDQLAPALPDLAVTLAPVEDGLDVGRGGQFKRVDVQDVEEVEGRLLAKPLERHVLRYEPA